MTPPTAIRAELTWVDGALRPGIEVGIDADGRIGSVRQRTVLRRMNELLCFRGL